MLQEKLEGRKDVTIWPQLYAKASTGKIKTWQIGVTLNEDDTAIMWTMHGFLDGKKQLKPKPIKIGKNIGKKNETTPYDQALSEALSKHKKQIDKKYIIEIPTAENEPNIYLPMLAKKLEKDPDFPVLSQPKLNGVRGLNKKIDPTTVNITSRKFKSYNETMPHIRNAVLPLLNVDEYFDGELYRYGWTFQQILRRVKKLRPDSDQVQLWVYDMIPLDLKMKALERNQLYHARIPDNHPNIVKVESRIVHNAEELEEHHRENVGRGFEGTIIRTLDGLYVFDYRSPFLRKKKDFIDEEFMIVGSEVEINAEENPDTGEIIEKEMVVFVFEVNDGTHRTFKARPRGTVEDRVKWLREIDRIKGHFMTVRFLEYSEDNIPTGNTVGIAFRDYE